VCETAEGVGDPDAPCDVSDLGSTCFSVDGENGEVRWVCDDAPKAAAATGEAERQGSEGDAVDGVVELG